MARYFLELKYKGTHFHGFQIQDNARTIQAEVEKALKIFYKQSFALTGSSRTDAGVHALQNYFHFDTDLPLEAKHIYNLNALLPTDIAILSLKEVAPTAHCRFDAVARAYRYHIYTAKDPFLQETGWYYPYAMDIDRLNEGAAALMEYTDFTSFSKRNTQVYTFNCSIMESWWEVIGDREKGIGDSLVYHVTANRFLRGMVRGLVGTMVKLGRDQMDIAGFRNIIEAKDCGKADFSTPPQGLFLERVVFP